MPVMHLIFVEIAFNHHADFSLKLDPSGTSLSYLVTLTLFYFSAEPLPLFHLSVSKGKVWTP